MQQSFRDCIYGEFGIRHGHLQREPTIYLLPEWETEREALEYLACVSNEILEEQLNGWYRVPAVWPGDREFTHLSPLVRVQLPFGSRRCL